MILATANGCGNYSEVDTLLFAVAVIFFTPLTVLLLVGAGLKPIRDRAIAWQLDMAAKSEDENLRRQWLLNGRSAYMLIYFFVALNLYLLALSANVDWLPLLILLAFNVIFSAVALVSVRRTGTPSELVVSEFQVELERLSTASNENGRSEEVAVDDSQTDTDKLSK